MSALLAERQAAYEAALAELKGKRRAFVEAYVGAAQFHGTNAAIAAGYSPKTAVIQASQILSKLNVKAAIAAYFAMRAMPAEEVLRRISDHAAASIEDFIDIVPGPSDDEHPVEEAEIEYTDSGREVVTVKRVWGLSLDKAQKAGKLGLIKKLKATKYGTEIELVDQQAALALLARHHKLLGDEGGILKYIDLSKLSDEQITAIANGADPLATLLGTKE